MVTNFISDWIEWCNTSMNCTRQMTYRFKDFDSESGIQIQRPGPHPGTRSTFKDQVYIQRLFCGFNNFSSFLQAQDRWWICFNVNKQVGNLFFLNQTRMFSWTMFCEGLNRTINQFNEAGVTAGGKHMSSAKILLRRSGLTYLRLVRDVNKEHFLMS